MLKYPSISFPIKQRFDQCQCGYLFILIVRTKLPISFQSHFIPWLLISLECDFKI